MVHCYGGLGRSAVIVCAAMLIKNKELNPDEVISLIRQLRGKAAVQTIVQYNALHSLASYLKGDGTTIIDQTEIITKKVVNSSTDVLNRR